LGKVREHICQLTRIWHKTTFHFSARKLRTHAPGRTAQAKIQLLIFALAKFEIRATR
jgi:hypothetical protein